MTEHSGSQGDVSKKSIDALEKVWWAEVNDLLPFQSNAQAFYDLEKAGLVQRMSATTPSKLGSIRFEGWQLTHAGRLLYCSTCGEDEKK